MKTAWFLMHRIREAMKDGSLGPIGGAGKTVEADETFVTKSPKTRREKHERTDTQILSLVERARPDPVDLSRPPQHSERPLGALGSPEPPRDGWRRRLS